MVAQKECLIELLDETKVEIGDENNASPKATKINLHALSRIYNPKTIRVTGWVGGKPLAILVDSGSTHNFVQDTVVRKLGLAVEPLSMFRVFIDGGEFLVCKEVCRQVPINLQNVVLTEDLFRLNMGGANIVLGIQWLERLGLVTMDHQTLTMEFVVRDKTVRLQGDPHLADSEISASGFVDWSHEKR